MNSLPSELRIYLFLFIDMVLIASLNREFYSMFKEKLNIAKNRRLMSSVIDTLLVEKIRFHFKKSLFINFEAYIWRNLTNSQEINAFLRWWLKKYPLQNKYMFHINLYCIHCDHQTSVRTKNAITEYFRSGSI